MSDDHADVLALFARCEAPPMPETLEARVLRAAKDDRPADAATPLERAFDAHRDDAWSFALAAVRDGDVARDVLEDAFFRVHRRLEGGDDALAAADVLGSVRVAVDAVLPLLRKAGHADHPLGALEDGARALLLLRRAGLSPVELARAGAVDKAAGPAQVDEALRAAADALADALPAAAHEGGAARARQVVRAALDLEVPPDLEAHLATCAACGVLRERALAALDVPARVCPGAGELLRRVAERAEKDRAHRAAVASVAARVSIACSYCHAPMLRGESVFCAACLAPHHDDCFRDHGRCSAPGCQNRTVVRPGGQEAPRRRRWAPWLIGLGAVGAAAALTAAWSEARRRALAAEEARAAMRAELDVRERAYRQTAQEIQGALEQERVALARSELRNQELLAQLESERVAGKDRLATLWDELATMAREQNRRPEDLLDEARKSALERDVEALFAEIMRLAEAREVEPLIDKFTELRRLLASADGAAIGRERLAAWRQRLSSFGEVQLSIKLQIDINEGNALLKTLAEGVRDERWDAVEAAFAQLSRLAERMKAEEAAVFHRNADALYLRGKALAERARLLKRAAETRLDVTATDAAAGRCTVNGREYRAGEVVESTEVTVVEVAGPTVRFRLDGHEFVREVQPPR